MCAGVTDETSEKIPSKSVWIFARPLRFATILGSQCVPHGKYPFCHWGVLVTELDFGTVKRLLTEVDQCLAPSDDVIVGDMWELFRRENDGNVINVTRSYKSSEILETWNAFSAEKVGETEMSGVQIQESGNRYFYSLRSPQRPAS